MRFLDGMNIEITNLNQTLIRCLIITVESCVIDNTNLKSFVKKMILEATDLVFRENLWQK